MMRLVCWNIQWGKGADGRVDLGRIMRIACAPEEPDVLCLQEVARNFPALDGTGADQVAALASMLPGWEAVYGPGVDLSAGAAGERRQFGNLVLSRRPVLQAQRHLLPRPAGDEGDPMQRQATEVIVGFGSGIVRIVTTHLEYLSAAHRRAQVERLRELHREWCAHFEAPPAALAPGPDAEPACPAPGRCPTLICGDFNMEITEDAWARMVAPFDDSTPPLLDAWSALQAGEPHAPTCGIHELKYWDRAHARDFVFLTPDLAARARSFSVDIRTDASDHQPLFLRIDD